MLRRLLILFASLAVAWILGGALFCEMSLRVERRALPDIVIPGEERVSIAANDGIVLRGVFRAAPGKDGKCVLLLHGISDSRAGSLGFAPMFSRRGYSVLAVDSRAHGKSDGDLVTYGLLEQTDVLLWADWLRVRGCTRLYGLGESMGGAILIQAAARQRVFDAIVAECPFSELRVIAKERVVQWSFGSQWMRRALAVVLVSSGFTYARVRYRLNLDDAAPLRSAIDLKTPLLLIHGLEDRNISPAHSEAIAVANQNVALWLVPGAGHTAASAVAPGEFEKRVLEWFQNSL